MSKKRYNLAEKIFFALGLLVSVAIVGFLIFQVAQKQKTPPRLQVVSEYKADLPPYTYQIKVENTGEETAQSLNLQLSLYQDGQPVESGTLTIDYVPIKSSEMGWIVFDRERKVGDSLVVSAMTYIKP